MSGLPRRPPSALLAAGSPERLDSPCHHPQTCSQPSPEFPERLERPVQVAYSVCVRDPDIEGPVDPAKHCCIPALKRVDLPQVLRLIQRENHFVLHAPRQTGKTSTLRTPADRLNAAVECRRVYVNFEPGQSARHSVAAGLQTILADEAD